MELVLLLSAEQDLQTAYNWVNDHREGRGDQFLVALDQCFSYVRQFPMIGRVYRGRYRRSLIPKYPLGVFYVSEPKRIVIHAILDLRLDPVVIQRRLPGESSY
jgi:toxin ParE1/3/4